MSMLSIHTQALASQVACYHEFMSRYRKHGKTVYGFVEGNDDPSFYRGFIESALPPDWTIELWKAGNKDRVYEVYSYFSWKRWPEARICFFTDRDLSDLIPEKLTAAKNIYVTDDYSIENDIARPAVVPRIISELCGFSDLPHNDIDRVRNLYEQQLEIFCLEMIPLMSLVLAWRRDGQKPNLGDISLKELCSISGGVISMNRNPAGKPSWDDYLHGCCAVTRSPKTDTSKAESDLRTNGLFRRFIRGKFLLWFLVEFCRSIHRDAMLLFVGISKLPKMHVTLSVSNGVLLIGPRSRIPISLTRFIQETYGSYIKTAAAG